MKEYKEKGGVKRKEHGRLKEKEERIKIEENKSSERKLTIHSRIMKQVKK